MRKNFYPQERTPFVCANCQGQNQDANSSPRNHCKECLCSVHVDKDVPGDRLSSCKGIMEPVGVENTGKKGLQVIHACSRCKKRIRNVVAPDDNIDAVIRLSTLGIHDANLRI
jgi:DNA-directed RNA polymerase subunit RPC12/RpoP